jgi:hypothetical protein
MKQMNERIDLEEIERKMYKKANSDGIMELLLGILLFFMAVTYGRSSLTILPAFFFIFLGNRVIETIKAKFTYPRIGYVEFKQEDAIIGWGILGYILAVIAVVSVIATIFYGGNLEKIDFYKWVPLAIGGIFLGGMIYHHGKSGDPVTYLYSFITLVAGGIFTFYLTAPFPHNIELYLLSLAGFFILAGLVRLLTFMRRNPVVEMPDAD